MNSIAIQSPRVIFLELGEFRFAFNVKVQSEPRSIQVFVKGISAQSTQQMIPELEANGLAIGSALTMCSFTLAMCSFTIAPVHCFRFSATRMEATVFPWLSALSLR